MKTSPPFLKRQLVIRNLIVFLVLAFSFGFADLLLRTIKDKTLFCQEDCDYLALLSFLGRIDFTVFAVLFPVFSLMFVSVLDRFFDEDSESFFKYLAGWAVFSTLLSSFAVAKMFFDYETYCLYPIIFFLTVGIAGVFVLVSTNRWNYLALPLTVFVLVALLQTDVGSIEHKMKNKEQVPIEEVRCFLFIPKNCYDCSFVYKNMRDKNLKIGVIPPDESSSFLRMLGVLHYPVLMVLDDEKKYPNLDGASVYVGFHSIKPRLHFCAESLSKKF